jgi:hypothetical protein
MGDSAFLQQLTNRNFRIAANTLAQPTQTIQNKKGSGLYALSPSQPAYSYMNSANAGAISSK